jgi:hypothetical protein
MENVAAKLIDKLPVEYLMVLVPFLLIVAVWLFVHIRRDKQGKIYFYSQKYEDRKRNRKQDEMLKLVKEDHKNILQLEICARDLPATERRVAYRDYKRLGYNSWADDYVVKEKLFLKSDVDFIHNNPELPG